MSKASEKLRRRREAKKQLIEINKNRNNVLVIHYSCEISIIGSTERLHGSRQLLSEI